MSARADLDSILAEVLVDEQTLQTRITELGREISADYADTDDLLLVCVLRGAVMFLTDLIRSITIPHHIDFLATSSYGAGARRSTGQVRIAMDINTDIEGRRVLIVEDIVDEGHTISHVIDLLQIRSPASLKVCTLLDKKERRKVEASLDYVGFEIPNKFVFGYGLDLDEYWRNLPFIGVVKPDVYLTEG